MTRRNGLSIMASLIGLIKPLIWIMALAVVLGTVGFLCAISLTYLATLGLLQKMDAMQVGIIMILAALFRGILHYGEQYCNHYIAFKLLAIIRHKVFAALRILCPAKLDGKEKGNLISIITSDIELLEVFYAHTISPILIAIFTSLILIVVMAQYSIYAAFWAGLGYLFVGAILPLYFGKKNNEPGMQFRNEFGDLNSFVLDSLRGLDESIQYGQTDSRSMEMEARIKKMNTSAKQLNQVEAKQRSMTNFTILFFSIGMFVLLASLSESMETTLLCTVLMMSSFGPVTALSNLSNNLAHTLASGQRVLDLLEEQPVVEDIEGEEKASFGPASLKDVNFAYKDEQILNAYSLDIEEGKILGLYGQSGSGKSTVLKLLMRFWDVQSGKVQIGKKDIRKINTSNLRQMEAYMTQETSLFHDTIANNVAIAKEGATMEEIQEACKKASIHDFIQRLPKGYDTMVGELGETLSGGERQRIGLARAFLKEAPFLLLDEPTSNLDALNEGMILRSLKKEKGNKTIVLVSHRPSTMNIASQIIKLDTDRRS